MSSLLRRSASRSAGRRRAGNSANWPRPATPIGIVSAAAAAALLTIGFDQAVSLSGIPAFGVNVAGAVPQGAVQVDDTHIQITFDRDISAATTLNIPYREPAIRNATGGFVIATSVTLA